MPLEPQVLLEPPVCRECPASAELLVCLEPREREVMVVQRELMAHLAKMVLVVCLVLLDSQDLLVLRVRRESKVLLV